MTVTVSAITATGDGANVRLFVVLSDGEHRDKRELLVLASRFASLGVAKGEIDEATFSRLEKEAELCLAVRRGVSALSYGPCSERQLAYKLRHKGISEAMARAAVRTLVQMGYIDEASDTVRLAERGVAKQWGQRRIAAELLQKGYREAYVKAAVNALDEEQILGNCEALIASRYGTAIDDPCDRKKAFSALVRLGYSASQIQEAYARFKQENI